MVDLTAGFAGSVGDSSVLIDRRRAVSSSERRKSWTEREEERGGRRGGKQQSECQSFNIIHIFLEYPECFLLLTGVLPTQ